MNQLQTTSNEEIVSYEVDGNEVNLSPSIVQQYLVGNAPITEQEFMFFATLCKARKLNPFLKEAYIIKYSERQPASIVVSKDYFLKVASRNSNYDGIDDGIIVQTQSGEVQMLTGTFYPANTRLVGGWATVYLKSQSHPKRVTVRFEEYCKYGRDGQPLSNWKTMPAIMINKVAKVAALRESFPEDFSAMYDEAELSHQINYDNQSEPTIYLNEKVVQDTKAKLKSSEPRATEQQKQIIKNSLNSDSLQNMLVQYQVNSVDELTVYQASEILQVLNQQN